MSTAPKQSVSQKTLQDEVLSDAIRSQAAPKLQQKTAADPFSSIEANTFHKIMFDPNMTPEQKKVELAKRSRSPARKISLARL